MLSANPAVEAFLRALREEKVWAQLSIVRRGEEFEVRHADDREIPFEQLKRTAISEARKLGAFNGRGQFRPLRSSPDLQRGWVLFCKGPDELWRALQELYPGSIPDWFAARAAEPPVTNYREFTNRQSGMYRITTLLTDEQAGNVTRAACHARFCLKRRLWTAPGLAVDGAGTKSEIPCLEPCAVLLELARKTARIEQEEKLDVQLSRSELESFLAAAKMAAQAAVESGGENQRIGNIGSASNPRRLQLLIEKFKQTAPEKDAEE